MTHTSRTFAPRTSPSRFQNSSPFTCRRTCFTRKSDSGLSAGWQQTDQVPAGFRPRILIVKPYPLIGSSKCTAVRVTAECFASVIGCCTSELRHTAPSAQRYYRLERTDVAGCGCGWASNARACVRVLDRLGCHVARHADRTGAHTRTLSHAHQSSSVHGVHRARQRCHCLDAGAMSFFSHLLAFVSGGFVCLLGITLAAYLALTKQIRKNDSVTRTAPPVTSPRGVGGDNKAPSEVG